MVEIWWLFVGRNVVPRLLSVDSSTSLSCILSSIKEVIPDAFVGVRVSLYLAKQNGEWVDARSDDVAKLSAGDGEVADAVCRTELNLEDSASEHFVDLRTGVIHLLIRKVAPPQPAVLGKRTRSGGLVGGRILWCVVVANGDNRLVRVVVRDTSYLRELEFAIKAEAFKNNLFIRALPLQLWTVRGTSGEWLLFSSVDKKTALQNVVCTEIDPKQTLGAIFSTSTDANLHVVVKPPYFEIDEDEEIGDNSTDSYHDTAAMLKTTNEVNQLVDDIVRVGASVKDNPRNTPLMTLDNSSGTGKTQMAFNLMARDELEVFYTVYGEDQRGSHLTFGRRSLSFLRCVNDDLEVITVDRDIRISNETKLYMFGFFWALVAGAAEFFEPRTRQEVWEKLKETEEGCRTCVFFLDKFPRINDDKWETQEHTIRLMMSVFRSLGFAVILSGSTGLSDDIIRMGKQLSGESDEVWGPNELFCIVQPSLPLYQNAATSTLPLAWRNIICPSRPSFAKVAMEHLTKYAETKSCEEEANFAECMNGIVTAVATECVSPAWRRGSTSFLIGQVLFFLATCHDDGKPTKARLIVNHLARLREYESFVVFFDLLHDLPVCNERPWVCRCRFSRPECDALMHLCLVGCIGVCAFGRLKTPYVPFHEAFAQAQKTVDVILDFDNTNQHKNDGMRMEAFVSGAIVVASHWGGFSGMSFLTFLPKFLFELGVSPMPSIDNLAVILAGMSCYRAQNHPRAFHMVSFFAPPNVEWPDVLLQTPLNLGTLRREPDSKMIDISFLDGKITVECKDYKRSLNVDVLKDF